MAIYHLHIDSYRRSRGRTAIGGAAYRRGLKASCPVSGKRFNFRAKSEVVFSEFVPVQNDATDYTQLAHLLQLYEAIERTEKHPRATLGREIEAALPHELDLPQQVELVRAFVAEVRNKFGAEQAFFDFSIHAKEGNQHVHVCMAEREQIEPFVFAKTKRRDWDGEEFVRACREIWQTQTNSALERNGINQRVDCRSNADRGLRLLPSFHEGKAAYFNSEVKQMNDTIKQQNQQLQAANEVWEERKKRGAVPPPNAPVYMVKCANEHLPDSSGGNTRLLDEHQYYEAFPYSPLPSHVAMMDCWAVLHYPDRSRLVDHGDQLASIGAPAGVAADRLIWLAMAKGWRAITLDGDEAFLRAAFAMAMEHGVKIIVRDEWQMSLLEDVRAGRASRQANAIQVPAINLPTLVLPKLSGLGAKLGKTDRAPFLPASTKKRRHGL